MMSLPIARYTSLLTFLLQTLWCVPLLVSDDGKPNAQAMRWVVPVAGNAYRTAPQQGSDARQYFMSQPTLGKLQIQFRLSQNFVTLFKLRN